MKKIILLLFLINHCHSQTSDDINKLDTIYIIFEKINTPRFFTYKENENDIYIGDFYFKKRNDLKNKNEKLIFSKKHFLKVNKYKIVDFSLNFIQYIYTSTSKEKQKTKTYYIIDKDKVKKNKVKLIPVEQPRIVHQ